MPASKGTYDWSAVAAGHGYSIALKKDGSMWTWGYNRDGQLGNGMNKFLNTPARIGTDNDWSELACAFHSMALKKDGSMWAWGYNHSSELGDGTFTDRNSPVLIGIKYFWGEYTAGYNDFTKDFIITVVAP